MIVPLTNKAQDVNVALVKIASMNNKEIDEMKQEAKEIQAREEEMQERFKTQRKRWTNYKTSYDAIMRQAEILMGGGNINDLISSLPGYTG